MKWVIGRICIPKCDWKIIVVNLVEERLFFSWRCLVISFCVPGQYRVFPPLAAIIAASRRGILATRRWRRCTRICAHLSYRALRSSSRFWGGLSIELIARPNSSQRCSMGLQSGDLGGCSIFVTFYSIHVPGWLQKWLNLITAPGSVSNEPGSVTWLATKYLKTVSWRNHTEKLTTWWPQNISFWPKINIPSSYFTILMLNCLENTLKLQFDSYVTAVRFLT